LIAARAATRELVIWSAACSTGQEPYSLAMLLDRDFPELAGWDVRIVATDYSEAHLEKARAGRYSQYEINRGLPASLLVRWFQKRDDAWVVRPELRDRVELAAINLVTDWPPVGSVDLVLLRNVMIYWDDATKRAVLHRIRQVLAPHGALVLGTAETTLNLDERYARVAASGASYYVP
jgi:chemotaxis protein methyltransferase CheR